MRFRAVLKYVEASVFALSNTALSLLYIVVGSRCLLPLNERKGDCIVLGNGPSLRTDLESIRRLTRSIESIFCVNSFALTPEYLDLRPSHYVLLDPGLWYPGFRRWSSIGEPIANAIAERSDWPLTLFLPVEARGGDGCIIRNPKVTVRFYNRTPVTGLRTFEHFAYRVGLGQPRPQNVLCAAIFIALNLGCKRLFVFGADHSWHTSLIITDDNLVCMKQPHFYEGDCDVTLEPIYKNPFDKVPYTLAELLGAWANVFRSYEKLERYSHSIDAKIWNCGSLSFIDAFERLRDPYVGDDRTL
jgi:hypothetical protein